MINEFGFSVSCVHSCGYGVDTDYFSPRYAKADKPMILAAGTANRDYKTLISAVQDLDVDLHIAADSAWYPVETNAHGLDLPSNVTLKSAGDYAGLRQLYSKCRFVVVPMLPAKFACGFAVIAEAMAMGKPVIATRTEALSDFIHEGETGFLVDVGDVSGLRERIQWMIKHPEIVDSMGNFARRMMQEKWSLPAYCERLESAVIAASDEFRRGTEWNTIGSKLYVESNATG
jgi:glycosyltransferase involved in cell wall biosynthesis